MAIIVIIQVELLNDNLELLGAYMTIYRGVKCTVDDLEESLHCELKIKITKISKKKKKHYNKDIEKCNCNISSILSTTWTSCEAHT